MRRVVACWVLAGVSSVWAAGEPQTDPNDPGRFLLDAEPDAKPILLSNDFKHATQAYLLRDSWRKAITVDLGFGPDGVTLYPPDIVRHEKAPRYAIEVAQRSEQFPDGRIIFPIKQARRVGTTAVAWAFNFTRWGMYEAEVTYALASTAKSSPLTLAIDDKEVEKALPPGADNLRYRVGSLGRIYLAKAGHREIFLRGFLVGGGLRVLALTLRPAPEGKNPVAPDFDGVVKLHAKRATVQGVSLRYEPNPKKDALGFWTNPQDFAWWQFKINKAGMYKVEVLQGCGNGQGGSRAAVTVGSKTLEFEVEETGGFQDFVPRSIGTVRIPKPGLHTLKIQPLTRAKEAVMDVRQIRLIPAK